MLGAPILQNFQRYEEKGDVSEIGVCRKLTCIVIGMFQKLSREPEPNGRHHRRGTAGKI